MPVKCSSFCRFAATAEVPIEPQRAPEETPVELPLLQVKIPQRSFALFGPLIRSLHTATDELRLAAGSDPLTVAWAREHHLPPEAWTIDPEIAEALHEADDD